MGADSHMHIVHSEREGTRASLMLQVALASWAAGQGRQAAALYKLMNQQLFTASAETQIAGLLVVVNCPSGW